VADGIDQSQLNGLGVVLKGRTLAIWGYGKIGRSWPAMARRSACRWWCGAASPAATAAVADGQAAAVARGASSAGRCAEPAPAPERCDARHRHRRRPGAHEADRLFVNTSRAELVQPDALEQALRGPAGYAALDVFESEPLPADAPLLRIPTVLATPHLGYVEKDSYELYFRMRSRTWSILPRQLRQDPESGRVDYKANAR
jgi:D-3-phosphoglycerate dehydrogenase